ncbi:VA713 protein, partial [Acromyrmex heyeri]
MLSSGKRSLSKEDIKTADKDEKESLLEHDSDLDEEMLFTVKLQIQEVADVMRDNVQKVIDRGERLEDLQQASDRLNMTGNEFREAAKRAQRRAWLQNVKSRIIIISITVTIVLFIVARIVFSFGHHGTLPGSQITSVMFRASIIQIKVHNLLHCP